MNLKLLKLWQKFYYRWVVWLRWLLINWAKRRCFYGNNDSKSDEEKCDSITDDLKKTLQVINKLPKLMPTMFPGGGLLKSFNLN